MCDDDAPSPAAGHSAPAGEHHAAAAGHLADPVTATTMLQAEVFEATILMRDHPQWAIWLPARGGDWTAVRPASARPPTPELPTIWVHADTARELARIMHAADEQLSGHGWPK